MKASTKRALSLLLAVALVVAVVVIFATFIKPAYQDIQNLRALFYSKTDLVNVEQKAIGQVQNLIADYKGTAKLEEQLSLALPNEESVSSVMSQLNAISQLNGISIQGVGIEYLPIKPSTTKLSSAKGLGTLRLDLRLFGSYAAFKAFLGDMEKNVRIMDLRNLKIEQAGKPNNDIFFFTLGVDTYYQPKK